MVNPMGADDLAMKRAMTSAVTVLPLFTQIYLQHHNGHEFIWNQISTDPIQMH